MTCLVVATCQHLSSARWRLQQAVYCRYSCCPPRRRKWPRTRRWWLEASIKFEGSCFSSSFCPMFKYGKERELSFFLLLLFPFYFFLGLKVLLCIRVHIKRKKNGSEVYGSTAIFVASMAYRSVILTVKFDGCVNIACL